MTQQPHWCPVDDCEFGVDEDATLRSVRSHINAATSEGHDWEALKPVVHDQAEEQPDGGTDTPATDASSGEQAEPDEEQSEAVETSPSEQAETPPEGTGSDGSQTEEAESDGEQTEAGEISPSEQAETGSEMATQDEYEQQQQVQQPESTPEGDTEGEPSGESPSNGEQSGTGDDDQGVSGGFHVPNVGTSTMLVLAGLVLAAFLVWRLLDSDGGQDVTEDIDTGQDDDESEPMVDVEAGTGGVSV